MKTPPARRAELDEVIVNVELTLASIVQGLALSFLADNAGAVLSKGPPAAWLYVGVAFLIILIFWSRALIHTLTLIRWPLEFVHNFFYFACALVEVLAFKNLHDPFMWFVLNAVFAVLVWGLFMHDLRIIRLRARDSVGPSSFRLYAIVEADQRLNIRIIMPSLFAFALGSALAIKMAPEFFLVRQGHLLLIGCQGVVLMVYLACVVRSFTRITPLISATRAEWRDDVEEGM
ncbi:MAG TPA: hypothetical protein VNP98_14390 [Chthoniobacterales bacterium]|nr:hypothetical protein [Chthoniobacterales bacterium]